VQIKKLKDEKKTQQKMLDQLVSKESLVNKKIMTELIEIEKSSDVKVHTLEKGTRYHFISHIKCKVFTR
jgi:hypothetical protein